MSNGWIVLTARLPDEGPLQIGSVSLPAGVRIVSGYGTAQQPVACATTEPVPDAGLVLGGPIPGSRPVGPGAFLAVRHRDATSDEITAHDTRAGELARHKPGRISADDADGYHRIMCPAAMGKIRCPLRPQSMTLDRGRPENAGAARPPPPSPPPRPNSHSLPRPAAASTSPRTTASKPARPDPGRKGPPGPAAPRTTSVRPMRQQTKMSVPNIDTGETRPLGGAEGI
jgi:hypothetical protein